MVSKEVLELRKNNISYNFKNSALHAMLLFFKAGLQCSWIEFGSLIYHFLIL